VDTTSAPVEWHRFELRGTELRLSFQVPAAHRHELLGELHAAATTSDDLDEFVPRACAALRDCGGTLGELRRSTTPHQGTLRDGLRRAALEPRTTTAAHLAVGALRRAGRDEARDFLADPGWEDERRFAAGLLAAVDDGDLELLAALANALDVGTSTVAAALSGDVAPTTPAGTLPS
jgi:hypothetical protein